MYPLSATPSLPIGYVSELDGPIGSIKFSLSLGVVSKPKASAKESVVVPLQPLVVVVLVDDCTIEVVFGPSLVSSLVVVAGGGGEGGGMVAKPRACTRESAAEMVGVDLFFFFWLSTESATFVLIFVGEVLLLVFLLTV